MGKDNLELYDSEWAILRVMWEQEPCTAPDVQETLESEKGWAYTTVKTIMDRMVRKGLLQVEKLRNLHIYRSAVTRPQAQRSELMRTLKRAFNDSLTPMMQFLVENDELSEEEYRHLADMIENREGGRRASRGKK